MSTLSVLNPFKPLLTEREASIAARAGAVGAFLSVASGMAGIIHIYLQKAAMLALMRESVNLQNATPEVAQLTSAGMEFGIYFSMGVSAVVAIVYLVFGLIQWRRRTKLIPLIMFLISVLGLLMGLFSLFTIRTPAQAALMPPGWQLALNWAMVFVNLGLYWAGVRGGNWLQKTRNAEPTSPNQPVSSAR